MDQQCIYFVPPVFNNRCELLSEVAEPSLSSLEDSLLSDLCQPVMEESFSEGEVVKENKKMMTSTPQRNASARRSISLVDVSKIDNFSTRPLGIYMAPWETMGSQSSVGKSRDSGYVHSGSLLSLNSGKLSEAKMGVDNYQDIVEENLKLKQELEYSYIIINTLHQSVDDLRSKNAEVQNSFSEFRLNHANNCNCFSKQNNKVGTDRSLLNSRFLTVTDSSGSESSRSSSPDPYLNSYINPDLNQPLNSALSTSAMNKTEETTDSGDEMNTVNEYIVPPHKNKSKESIKRGRLEEGQLDSIKNWNCSVKNMPINNPTKLEPASSSCFDKTSVARFDAEQDGFCVGNQSAPSCSNANDSFEKSKPYSLNSLIQENVEKKDSERKSLFVANEMNGKIWVGSFKPWGDSSVRVVSKSPLTSINVSSISSPVNLHKKTDSISSGGSAYIRCNSHSSVRPFTVYSTDSSSSDASEPYFPKSPRNKSLETQSHEISFKPIYPNKTSVLDSVKVTVSSRSNRGDMIKISPNSKQCCSSYNISKSQSFNNYRSDVTKDSIHRFNGGGSVNSNLSTNPRVKVRLSSTPDSGDLSNLGVSVTKSANVSLNSELDKWEYLKSKFNRLSFSPSSTDSSSNKVRSSLNNSNSILTVTDQSPSLMNQSKLIRNSSAQRLDLKTQDSSPSSLFRSDTSPSILPSQDLQDCLDKAHEYASQLSHGLSLVPSKLDYIRSIGKP